MEELISDYYDKPNYEIALYKKFQIELINDSNN